MEAATVEVEQQEKETPPKNTLPVLGERPNTNKDYDIDQGVVQLPVQFNFDDVPQTRNSRTG